MEFWKGYFKAVKDRPTSILYLPIAIMGWLLKLFIDACDAVDREHDEFIEKS